MTWLHWVHFIAGRFSCTYNSVDIGIAEDGHTLSWQVFKEMINNTDQYGDTDIDAIYRGMNVFLQTTLKEYKAGSLTPATPYNTFAPSGATNFALGVIGRLDTNVAKTLVMTSTASTPAAAAPATLTATYAILAPGYSVELFFGPRHRRVPIRFQLYPYDSTGTIIFYSAT